MLFRASLAQRFGAASLCAGLAASAASATTPQSSFSWKPSAEGPQYAEFFLDTPTTASGPATLNLNVSGDLDWSQENLVVKVDGHTVATLFTVDGEIAQCGASKQPATVTIPQATIAGLIGDGEVVLRLEINSEVDLCGSAATGYYSIDVDGTLYVPGETGPAPVQEKTAVAASMTQSRSSVTIASLPSLSGRAGGGAPSGGGGGVSGSGSSSGGNFAFNGDFSSMRRAVAANEAARRFAALGEARQAASAPAVSRDAALDGQPPEAAPSVAETAAPFDIWFGGSFSYFDVELGGVGQTGGVGGLQVGVDTRLNDRVLLGVAVFGDLLQSDVSTGSRSSGLGVMAGPYAVIELDYGLYLEALAAYGVAFNRIESEGLRDARFESQRQLYTARLSGEWSAGAWVLRPSSRLTYYAESQDSFDVGDGTIAPSGFSELGQLRFGPQVVYQMYWDGGAFAPFASMEGVWAFKQSEQVVNGAVVSSEEFTGTVALGFDALIGRSTLRAGGRLDGIGEPKLDTVTGEITIRTPLP